MKTIQQIEKADKKNLDDLRKIVSSQITKLGGPYRCKVIFNLISDHKFRNLEKKKYLALHKLYYRLEKKINELDL